MRSLHLTRRAVRRRPMLAVAVLTVLSLVVSVPTAISASATGPGQPLPGEVPEKNITIAAQAPLTFPGAECFMGLGVEPEAPVNGQCPPGGKLKQNSGYLWGRTADEQEENIWFGTTGNFVCGATASYAAPLEAAGLNAITTPFENDEVTCELDQSFYAQNNIPPTAGIIGDLRQAQIYQYNIATGQLIDRSPVDDPNFPNVAGIRSAGSLNNVVLLGGIETDLTDTQGGGTVNLFAFRESDGQYLGSQRFPQYNNTKNWFVHDGQMYTGMALTDPDPTPGSAGATPVTGEVLKWMGNEQNPFRFQVVGRMATQPTYFGFSEGRIVTGTWVSTLSDEAAGMYVSPPPRGPAGLTPADRNNWQKVFTADEFFPDRLTAQSQYSYGHAEFDGWVYFAFSSIVGNSTLGHLATYPDMLSSPRRLIGLGLTYLRAEPAATVLRARNLASPNPEIELLYGDRRYWNFHPDLGRNGQWRLEPNLLGQAPKFGPGGFGNRWADYAGWGVDVFRDELYFGGFDIQRPFRDVLLDPNVQALDGSGRHDLMSEVLGHRVSPLELNIIRRVVFPQRGEDGADTWVFSSEDEPAKPLTENGFNNATNWGNRGITPIGDEFLFLGTNGGYNYPVEPRFDPPRRAGWQLLKMTPE